MDKDKAIEVARKAFVIAIRDDMTKTIGQLTPSTLDAAIRAAVNAYQGYEVGMRVLEAQRREEAAT